MDAWPVADEERFQSAIRLSNAYLEFGSGRSTELAARRVPVVWSVESDPVWAAKMKRRAPKANVLLADIGPVLRWGYPRDPERRHKFSHYPLGVWDRMDASPDLVLIDGRFRVACFAAVMLRAAPGTTVLFDDYVDREHYHVVEELARPVARFSQMMEFVVPVDVQREAAEKMLLDFTADPR